MTPPAIPAVLPTDLETALVPEGRFRMGYDRGRSNEAPAHGVHIDAFALALRPVTRAEYQALPRRHRPAPAALLG